MTDFEKGRAAGLSEAVKVAEAYAREYSAQIKRLQVSLPPRGGPERTAILDDIAHDSDLLETAVEIAKSLRALSTLPSTHVVVPVEPTEAMLEAALDATGERILPFEAERESGVPVECDISEEDALAINEGTKAAFAAIYRAMIAEVKD